MSSRHLHLQHCPIVALTLIIPGGEYSHEHILVHHVEPPAALLGLVAADNEGEAIAGTEGLGDVPCKLGCNATARRLVDSKHIWVCILPILYWVGPEDVEDPAVARMHQRLANQRPRNRPQVIELPGPVPNAPMHAEDLLCHQACHW